MDLLPRWFRVVAYTSIGIIFFAIAFLFIALAQEAFAAPPAASSSSPTLPIGTTAGTALDGSNAAKVNSAVQQGGAADTLTVAGKPVTNWLSYTGYPNIPVMLGSSAGMSSLATSANTTQGRATGRLGLYLHSTGMQDLQQNYPASVAAAISGTIFPSAQFGGGVAELTMPTNASKQYQASTAAGYFGAGGSAWNLFYTRQGFLPKTCNVNGLDVSGGNQSLADWQDYASKLAGVGMTRCGVFGDPNSAPNINNLDFTTTYWDFYRQVALALGGVALDAPPGFALSQGQGYLNNVVQKIQWANANGLRSSVVLAVYNDGGNFLANVKRFVGYLKSNNALPTEWVVGGYLDGGNNSSAVAGFGAETTAGTLNEAALWVAQNAQVTPYTSASLTAPTNTGPAVPIFAGGRPATQLNAADVLGLGARAFQNDTDALVAAGPANSIITKGSAAGSPVTSQASGTDTDIPYIFGSKGKGYISTTIPDGTVYGGSTPGSGSVQIIAPGTRGAPNQAATGANATLIGGTQNSAAGNQSANIGGVASATNGSYSGNLAGNQNQLLGTGSGTIAGQFAFDRNRYNFWPLSGGKFANIGDAQTGTQLLRGSATLSTSASVTVRVTADAGAPGSTNNIDNIPVGLHYHTQISASCRGYTSGGTAIWADWDPAGASLDRSNTGLTYSGAFSSSTTAVRGVGSFANASLTISGDGTSYGLNATFTLPQVTSAEQSAAPTAHCVATVTSLQEVQ